MSDKQESTEKTYREPVEKTEWKWKNPITDFYGSCAEAIAAHPGGFVLVSVQHLNAPNEKYRVLAETIIAGKRYVFHLALSRMPSQKLVTQRVNAFLKTIM